MGESRGDLRDVRAQERDGRSVRRDRAHDERDSRADRRDRAATDRDAVATHRDWAVRDQLSRIRRRRAASISARAPRDQALDAAAALEQRVIDRESTLTELEMLERVMLDLLDNARQQRQQAAHDAQASTDDRHNAERSRVAAAADRSAAAGDRAPASDDREQAEISHNLVAMPGADGHS